MSFSPWLTTDELCQQLAINRSTLFALRRSGLLKDGRHLVSKNPSTSRSDLLWHRQRCWAALGSTAREGSGQQSCRCPQTPTGH